MKRRISSGTQALAAVVGLILFLCPAGDAAGEPKRTRLEFVPKNETAKRIRGDFDGKRVKKGRRCRPPKMARRTWMGVEPLLGAQPFRKPMQATPHPTDPSAWWVGETEGRILEARQDAVPSGEPPRVVLDIRDRVRAGTQWGFLSFAVAPGFPDDPRLFVTYTAQARSPKAKLQSRVSVFRSTDGGRTFDPETEEVLLAESQNHVWHPIAGLRFGPDGFLYVGWGEGSAGKSLVRDQLLRGKILRIDVSQENGRAYEIPEDNPFRAGTERPEVWATGFRNPWRLSFDP